MGKWIWHSWKIVTFRIQSRADFCLLMCRKIRNREAWNGQFCKIFSQSNYEFFTYESPDLGTELSKDNDYILMYDKEEQIVCNINSKQSDTLPILAEGITSHE